MCKDARPGADCNLRVFSNLTSAFSVLPLRIHDPDTFQGDGAGFADYHMPFVVGGVVSAAFVTSAFSTY